jgi:hypothetical protein
MILFVDPLLVRCRLVPYPAEFRRVVGVPEPEEPKIVDGDWDSEVHRRYFPDALHTAVSRLINHQELDASCRFSYRKRKRGAPPLRRITRLISSLRSRGCLLKNGDNIRVAVGRHGDLLFLDGGTHRLAVARCLPLKQIPVLVVAAHLLWDGELAQIR